MDLHTDEIVMIPKVHLFIVIIYVLIYVFLHIRSYFFLFVLHQISTVAMNVWGNREQVQFREGLAQSEPWPEYNKTTVVKGSENALIAL